MLCLALRGWGVGSPSGQARLDQTIVSSLASQKNIQSTEQNLSFLSTTRDWNNLPENYKVANSVAQFKRLLSTNDVTVPKLYYNSNRFVEVVHCRLRNEMSDLGGDLFQRHLGTDGACDCGAVVEDASHYFLSCPLHVEARRHSIMTIPNFASITVKCLTHGDSRKTFAENKYIFEKVLQFIVLSKLLQ